MMERISCEHDDALAMRSAPIAPIRERYVTSSLFAAGDADSL
jgi:hypothetical protein